MSNPVAAFAHRTYNLPCSSRLRARLQRHDLVVGLVHGRTGQIVHRRVNDTKALLLTRLEVQDFGNTQTCVADQRATRLNHYSAITKAACIQFGQQLVPQGIGLRWLIAVVIDTKSTAKIDVFYSYAGGLNQLDQVQHAVHCVHIRTFLGDLRSDVAIDPYHP